MLKKEEVTISLSRSKASVTSEAQVGPFIVHPRINKGEMVTDAYTVTHRTTGLAVWTTPALTDAIRVAEWLDEQKILPEQSTELWAYRATLQEPERAKLIEQLSAVAIRFVNGSTV